MAVKIDRKKCCYCSGCVAICPVDALTLEEVNIRVDSTCVDCLRCVNLCPVGAIIPDTNKKKK